MKVTIVTVAAGATATPIPVSIPAKFMKILQNDIIPEEVLWVQHKQSDGTFATEVVYQPSVPIRIQGYSGVIGRCPNYVANGIPSVGDPCCKIRTESGNEVDLKVFEYENNPMGED